ncbi:MAG: substrate-binding domain-containing protein [Propionibacteriaceae bacterium]|jgi:ribose transport system substrate-binding protein|nr:substrate-binding domain-containing protein [Propionibacteriaceae bacterium]
MMRKLHRWASVALSAAVMVSLTAGCSNPADGGSGADASGKVALLLSTMNNPFFVSIRDGAQQEADNRGVSLNVLDAQNDPTTQANQVQTAVANKATAIIINPVDSDAAAAAIRPALDAKIPVVAVDRGITGVTVDSFIASDNVAGGKQAADILAKAIGESGEVIVLEGIPGASSTRDRGQGFTDRIKTYPKITVVASQTANFDRTEGLDVTTNLMQANPGVVGIYAQNDEMALGAVAALGGNTAKAVKIVGFDGGDDALADVKAGSMVADIAQQPKLLGKQAVASISDILAGKTVDKTQSMPVETVTQDTVDKFTQANS